MQGTFEEQKQAIQKKLDDFMKEYDVFTMSVAPKHWRVTGTHFTELRKMREDINEIQEISEQEKNNPNIQKLLKDR